MKMEVWKNKLTGIAAILFGASFIFASCSTDSNNETPMVGHVRVLMTDAPFSLGMVSNANITIEKITLRQAGTDNDSTSSEDMGSPYMTVFEGQKELDLMNLQNGITDELADIDIEAGSYDLVRVYISDASIGLNDGSSYDLKIPSAASSGLKIFISPALNVEGGLTSELLLDFDLDRSLVAKGSVDHLQGFNFKPVIRAVNNASTGRIEGTITDSTDVALEDASVWIQIADTTFSATSTEEDGFYALIGVPAGTFTWYAAAENYDTLMIDDIEVVAGKKTTLDAKLAESE